MRTAIKLNEQTESLHRIQGSPAYSLAKIGFGTAENEPSKIWQNVFLQILAMFSTSQATRRTAEDIEQNAKAGDWLLHSIKSGLALLHRLA